ncbi:S41 family peptidase [Flavobacterium phragmitis]|uniref:Uncharacterized protein n=1 Tax=Flavobacterium phragmitis TaxID=739143 RepID=A0A1I1KYK0_9FLAO|nr:hypothetical protein [Flavobacterium phragmitis]SFC62480.1 hypothetical protein SAMN05216297_101489 [Flavobacterium phragmitis]
MQKITLFLFIIFSQTVFSATKIAETEKLAETCGSENKDHYKGKVIVLLNEESLSQAEWTIMCFQTAGNVTELDFKTFHTRYTGIGVYYTDKRKTQRIGIVPDIKVKPTIKGIQEGKDEVLDRALLFIETGK